MRALLGLALVAALFGCAKEPAALRVCDDPNNLPFSNRARQGFENRIVDLVARDLHRQVQYVWWAQRRGAVRETVGAGRCDLWPGVATGIDSLATTRPYYRSTYVFVTRAADHLANLTLDDPKMRQLKIGVQLVGDDGANTPPADALARRGIVTNVKGYPVYGDYRQDSPAAVIVDAVASGTVDVALVWGPLAGFHARDRAKPMTVTPVEPWLDHDRWPMAFDISMGVRKGDTELLKAVDSALIKHKDDIRAVLSDYAVPLAEGR